MRDLFKPVFEKLGVVESPVEDGLRRLHSELDNNNTLARTVRMDPGNFQFRVKKYIEKNYTSLSQTDKDSLLATYVEQSFSGIYADARANRIFTNQNDLASWMTVIESYITETQNRHGDIHARLGRMSAVYTTHFGNLDPESEWGKKAVNASFNRTRELLLFNQIQQFKKYVSADMRPIIEQAEAASKRRSDLLIANLDRLAQAYKDSLIPPAKAENNISSPSIPASQPNYPIQDLFKRVFKK